MAAGEERVAETVRYVEPTAAPIDGVRTKKLQIGRASCRERV